MNQERSVLLLRSSVLSDGCKITLLTMYYCLLEFGSFPSFADLARSRGVTVMTVHNHLKEAKESGVLLSKETGRGVLLVFDWNRLAKSVGFESEKSASTKVALKISMPKGADEVEIASRVQDPKDSKSFVTYFSALYREKCGVRYPKHRADANRMRLLVKDFGVDGVKSLIDFFARHRGRLVLGTFNIETLYEKRNRILSTMKRK